MRYFSPVDSRVNAPVLVVADIPIVPLPKDAPSVRVPPRMPGEPFLALKLSVIALSAASFWTRGLIPFYFKVFSNESIPSVTSSFASYSFFSATTLNF